MYRPARLHMLAQFIPWNLFLGYIDHKRLKIQAQMYRKTIAYLKTDRHTDRQTDRTDKHRMGCLIRRYAKPIPTWFLAPPSGTKVTDTGFSSES